MDEFADQIAWCEERRKIALDDIAQFKAGVKWFRNDEDITPRLLERAERDVVSLTKLITSYEKIRAARS